MITNSIISKIMSKFIKNSLVIVVMTSLLLTGVMTVSMSQRSFAQLLPKQMQTPGQTSINGAGATFPFPLIDTWRVEYQKVKPDVNINYQSIGSGGGVKQFTAKTVDFGASDAPLTAAERAKATNAVHIPETIGSVVAAYNIPGIPDKGLKLTGPVLADIFSGKIKKWNDPQIQSLNPDKKLPDANIVTVHRSDGSGTTFVWTSFLSKSSPQWNQTIGASKSVQWPSGVGAPGNEGVANAIKGSPNTIGYIELNYALNTKTPYAFIKNSAGKFVEPTLDTVKQAATDVASKGLPKGDASWEKVTLLNDKASGAYPIASFTYLLIPKDLGKSPNMNEAKAKALVDFIKWAITDGQKFSSKLGYVPLPDQVVKADQESLKSLTFNGKPI
jgi:phosphate transport system permease protein/phosphate transport system substrate-binding protein